MKMLSCNSINDAIFYFSYKEIQPLAGPTSCMIHSGFMLRFWVCLLFLFPLAAHQQMPGQKPVRTYKISLPQHARPLVVLDPGHGGRDEGAKVNYLMEKRLSLMTTLLVRKHLEDLGYRVIMTRSKDVFIPLQRRVSIANKTKAVLFASIHYNSAPSPEAHGIEVFYHGSGKSKRSDQSRQLAGCVLKELIGQTKALSRGVKVGNYHVLRETHMPAIIIEGGFMTNKIERIQLRDKVYLEKIGKGIAIGIDKYLKA